MLGIAHNTYFPVAEHANELQVGNEYSVIATLITTCDDNVYPADNLPTHSPYIVTTYIYTSPTLSEIAIAALPPVDAYDAPIAYDEN